MDSAGRTDLATGELDIELLSQLGQSRIIQSDSTFSPQESKDCFLIDEVKNNCQEEYNQSLAYRQRKLELLYNNKQQNCIYYILQQI
jgi:hypothetical protein